MKKLYFCLFMLYNLSICRDEDSKGLDEKLYLEMLYDKKMNQIQADSQVRAFLLEQVKKGDTKFLQSSGSSLSKQYLEFQNFDYKKNVGWHTKQGSILEDTIRLVGLYGRAEIIKDIKELDPQEESGLFKLVKGSIENGLV